MLEWDSSPNENPPTLITPPDIFRTMPPVRILCILGQDGQPMADAPSPKETIKWEGSPDWTTHGPPAVPDVTEINTADAGLRRSTRVTQTPTYHINYVVPVSPRDEFLDTMSRIQH